MNVDRVRERLAGLVGPERALWDEATLAEYSEDMTEIPGRRPDAVVRPRTVEEVQAIVRLAIEEGCPLVPAVARTNLGGLTLAERGGAIVDLREMNRIVAVDEKEMYAILEPGVTFGMMKERLDAQHPSLAFGYPLSPPRTSIVANCILDGLANLSFRHGAMSEWLNGLEVVLPTGEVVRTGAGALSPSWFGQAPLPHLTGLFVSWQGTTGIVTKAVVQLWPSRPFRSRRFYLAQSLEGGFEAMRRLSRTLALDDIGGLSWPTGKMLFGVSRPGPRDPDEPEFFVYTDVTGASRKELSAKLGVVDEVMKGVKRDGIEIEDPFEVEEIIRVNPVFKKFADFPMTLDFLTEHGGGGLTWIGTYGPTSRWEEAARKCCEAMDRSGFAPTIVARPMKGGHFGVLRLITIFDKKDGEEVERVRACNREICDIVAEHGFIPYKTPAWAVDRLKGRLDPGTAALIKRVKAMMDPHGIMNPGKWDL